MLIKNGALYYAKIIILIYLNIIIKYYNIITFAKNNNVNGIYCNISPNAPKYF